MYVLRFSSKKGTSECEDAVRIYTGDKGAVVCVDRHFVANVPDEQAADPRVVLDDTDEGLGDNTYLSVVEAVDSKELLSPTNW